jgi:hypothetical protein
VRKIKNRSTEASIHFKKLGKYWQNDKVNQYKKKKGRRISMT